LDREDALADFGAARSEWESAFAYVPDEALGYLKPGDDYALGGLLIHVTWVLMHYRRVLDGIIAVRFGQLGPQDPSGEAEAAGQQAKVGLAAGERAKTLAEMGRLHAAVVTAVTPLPEGDWWRKAAVIYGEGQDPYPTSPEDIVGWLREHYREHVEQSADLVADWRATR
jgi:hypothetical protein